MKESELKLGNDLNSDSGQVYEQMKTMKSRITDCSRITYRTEDCKADFDAFKQSLLRSCDQWVEDQRKKINTKFSKI